VPISKEKIQARLTKVDQSVKSSWASSIGLKPTYEHKQTLAKNRITSVQYHLVRTLRAILLYADMRWCTEIVSKRVA